MNCFQDLFTRESYKRGLEWFDHNLAICFVSCYWIFVVIGSFFVLATESKHSIAVICPISGIWSNLLFQSLVTLYGFCCVFLLQRNECDQVSNTTFDKIVYAMDMINMCLCSTALFTNFLSMMTTCNDKITHTGLYQMSGMNVIPILYFLLTSALMVLHKRMIMYDEQERRRTTFVDATPPDSPDHHNNYQSTQQFQQYQQMYPQVHMHGQNNQHNKHSRREGLPPSGKSRVLTFDPTV